MGAGKSCDVCRISIHALLAESDGILVFCGPQGSGISIHALLAESDELDGASPLTSRTFLSTLSLRRATGRQPALSQSSAISIHALLAESDCTLVNCNSNFTHFYPRSPCGERLRPRRLKSRRITISIHALLAESDQTAYFLLSDGMEFLSTLSLRRATA